MPEAWPEHVKTGIVHAGRYSSPHQQVLYYDRLVAMFEFFADWNLLAFDIRAADRFEELRRQRIRIATTDLKIASIALVNDATLPSANSSDFGQVPELRVESWLAN